MSDEPSGSALPGLGLFLEPRAQADVRAGFRTELDRVAEAERLGFGTAWIATRHFGSLDAGLPSALPFLGALAVTTHRIRIGTAVVPISFENPIRLAEDTAIVDHLSGGRLELGVGKGLPAGLSRQSYQAFGLEEADREAIYSRALAELKRTLGGEIPAGEERVGLYPPGDALLGRIWQATSRAETAAEIGRAGDGLQLNRSAQGGDPGEIQSGLIDAYLDAFDGSGAPRVGISRVILPAADRASAVALYARDLRARHRPDDDAEAQLVQQNAAFGSVADVLEKLDADLAVRRADEYLFHVPIAASSPEFGDALRIIATEIHPELPALHGSLQQSRAR